MGLPRATFEIPLDGGLLTRGDERVKPPGAAENLLNAEFDDTGGLRVRFPFGPVTNVVQGGGTLSSCRRFAKRDDELLVFTATALYSWDVGASKWVSRGTHLAIDTEETIRFASSGDQHSADRAELNGTVVQAWVEAGRAYAAAYNKATGAILVSPVLVAGTAPTRPRVTALATKILLTFHDTPGGSEGLYAIAVDPAAPVLSGAGTFISSSGIVTNTLACYDITRVVGADQAVFAMRLTAGTSYRVGTITAALGIATANPLRAAVGPIAVSCDPTGLKVQVVRDAGNIAGTLKIRGDLITISTLADVYTDQEIGTYTLPSGAYTTVNSIACAHRTQLSGGQYRCYAFWAYEQNQNSQATKTNYVDTGNNLGTQSTFLAWLNLASRAFDYGGSVYVWAVYQAIDASGGQQGQYLLYRDDGFLAASSRIGNAYYPQDIGHLPNVALTDGTTGYRWVGNFMRHVPTAPSIQFTARAPREVYFAFDSDSARRSVQIGKTLYISGSPIVQYDGKQLTEVGFLTCPHYINMTDIAAAGGLSAGTYAFKPTLRWMNSTGEVERSTSFITDTVVMAASHTASTNPNTPATWTTRKDNIAVEFWRTKVNPNAGDPFYLVSAQNPATTANPNRYIAEDKTVQLLPQFDDALSDAAIAVLEANPENDGVLESLPPPSASIITADSQRIYLAGVAGSPNTVWYSKYRREGSIVAFNDSLTFDVPADNGPITALGYIDGTLVVWCETATYAFAGAGFDDTGGGSNFTLARALSTEVGAVSQNAVNFSDDGWYVKTQRGWYLLDRGLNYSYMGAGAYRYDSESVLAVVNLKTRHQNRIVTPSRVLVFDSLVKKWAEWTISDALDMILDSSGACWYLTSTGPRKEIADWTGYAGTDASLSLCEVETTWLKPDGRQQGRYIVDYVQLLGEYRSAFKMRVRLAKDYEQTAPSSPNWHTDKTWTPFPTTNGSGMELRAAPAKKRCAAIKVRLSITAIDGVSPLGGPCLRLDSITGQYAVEPGVYGAIAATQKQ